MTDEAQKTEQSEVEKPKPKEKKEGLSILEHGVVVPGAIIAGSLLLIATGVGLFTFFSGNKKKKQKSKTTTLDS